MISKYYRISHISLGNNQFKSFSVLFIYEQPVFLLVNIFIKQITMFENIPPQRIRGNALCKNEISDEKYEEIFYYTIFVFIVCKFGVGGPQDY